MKQKTKKAANKRFKITKNGKILRGRQMAGHLKHAKNHSQKSRYKTGTSVSKPEMKIVRELLPYN
ncbi:50S ribosomal protein L35 [Candidatus Curtissbacteria bacterium]|nr:50S ribosomal protein L35 [Candidatus Curtissbacteria bacterium]